MKRRAIVLSGRVCTGKTTLADLLSKKLNAQLIESRLLVTERLPKAVTTRQGLQKAGNKLEKVTGGRWLSDAINRRTVNQATSDIIVVDEVRTADQVHFLRRGGWLVTHVHLTAIIDASRRRYINQTGPTSISEYESLARSRAEKQVDSLVGTADVVIDTDRCSAGDVFSRVVARIETRPVTASPLTDVLIGGQYGSEGKGNIAHYLAPEYDVLVRVGGPNAGHKVYRPDQDPYTFRQLPSGTLGNPNATLVIGAGAVISLDILLREIADLAVVYDKLVIDPRAMIIEKNDIDWEQEHLKAAIGSTSQGIGYATARKVMHRFPGSDVRLAESVIELKHFIGDTVEFFAGCLSDGKRILLEGTQGTSLSLHHGFYPHVTSRMTTATACLAEAGLAARHVRRVIMVCRTYPIRVGLTISGNTSGYMSQEIAFDEIASRSGISSDELQKNEIGSVSNRPRRVAEFDWAQLRRSLLLNGPTDIALTFSDYLGVANRKAVRYEQLNNDTLRFIEEIEKVCGIPVSMISTDFNERNIIDRRMW